MASIYKRNAETPKERLLAYIADVPQEMGPIQEQWSKQEKKAFCRKEGLQMDHLRKKIISAVKSLQEINSEWTAYIHQIGDEEQKKKETASYLKNSHEWILDAKDQGREAIDVLASLMADLELKGDSYDETLSKAAQEKMGAPAVVRSAIHLPTLGLPQFNGDPLKWPEFWARFQAEVGSQTIPEVTKLNYLLNCLVGAAKATASGYAIVPENYEVVTTVLQQRYGDENLIKKHLQSELKHLPVAQFKNLRPTIEKMEVILRQLEALGENINHPQIELAIEEKLPKWLLLEIYTKKSADPYWNVKRLRNYIEEAVALREMVDRYHGYSEAPNTNRTYQRDTKYQDNKRSSAMATIVKDKQSNGRKNPCVFCKGDHWNDDCKRYRTHKKRGDRVKELGMCYNCLNDGHYTKECRRKMLCFHCKEHHNSALCRHKFSEEEDREYNKPKSSDVRRRENPVGTQETAKSNNVALSTAVAYPKQKDENVLLLCKEIFLQKNNQRNELVKATIFFDTGSQKSFITDDLVQQLGLKYTKEKEDIRILGFGEDKSKRYKSKVTEVDILLQKKCLKRIKVNVVPFLTQKIRTTQVSKEEADRWSNTYETSISPRGTWRHPQILIGADYFYDFILPTSVKKLSCGFQLVNSSVGWMLTGKGILQEKHRNKQYLAQPLIVSTVGVKKIEDDIDNYWKLELIGIKEEETEETSDDICRKLFLKTVKQIDGRYSVSWPWKKEEPKLPSNYGLSLGRLKSTFESLRKKNYLQQYDTIIKQQLDHGIIEYACEDGHNGILHYLPHQAVVTPNKETTKIRVVYDASAKSGSGQSLNEALYRGPDMIQDMIGILLRWRQMKIAIIADIEKAYHQIELNELDRDSTRFLWIKDCAKGITNDNLVTFRFRRVPFGVICSQSLLAMVLQKHLEEKGTPFATKIRENLYVDNVIINADNDTEAELNYQEIKKIFTEVGMNIREFLSNNEEVNNKFATEDRHKDARVKVLGLNWRSDVDEIEFKFPRIEEKPKTKRRLLQFVARQYDPLGFIAPALLPWKTKQQELWKKKYEWDDPLKEDDMREIEEIASNWSGITISIPRPVTNQKGTTEIHVFTDASAKAYAASVYLRTDGGENSETYLLYAKTKLAPVKGLSIPRLELLGVLIGTRILNFVKKQMQLDITDTTIWSDAQCVLQWIDSGKSQADRFVENRLTEIRKSPATFRYVPTKENPSDLATRGMSPLELSKANLWWNGPEWLKLPKNKWPQWKIETKHQEEDPVINNDQAMPDEETHVCPVIRQEQSNVHSPLFDPRRFSKWSKLVRVAAYVCRMADKMKGERNFPEKLTPEEIKRAEMIIIRQAQEEKVDDEAKKKWSLILDDNVWKCQGRMENIEGPLPIYLPDDSRITHLYIKQIHEINGHSGISHTLAQLWKTTWIPKGRRTVTKIIKECYGCKRWQAKPFKLPEMPPHPGIRVRRSQPFQSIGLDYLGPIQIKKSVEPTKRWIALFTCLTTRAVHLEVVQDLSAESFMQTFRRYISRRGKPEIILSDNATQFKLASKLFNDLSNMQTIRWKFITERAPWQGGLYERLVGLTKQTMRKAIGRRLLNEEELRTLVADAEGIINSRPITQVADDSNEVLRPIDFLVPQVQTNILSDEEDNDEEYLASTSSTKDKLKKRWQQTKEIINKFWEIWKTNYLAILRDRTRREHKGPKSSIKRPPRLNEIVLVAEENVPRGNWLLGRIIEIRTGAGNAIRTARVQMPNGNIWTRPLNHLCPLEADIQLSNDTTNPQPNADQDNPILHPQNDPNLDKEDDEMSETSSQPNHVSKKPTNAANLVNTAVIKPVRKFWPIFFLLIAMIQVTIASMKIGTDCESSDHGVFMRLPERRNCSAIGQEHKFVEKLLVTVHSRIPIKIQVGACSKIIRTVCTRSFLRWWLEVTMDETTIEPMNLEDCLAMNQNKSFDDVALLAVGENKWISQVPTHYNYGFFGSTCYPVINYQIEKGFIVGGEDSQLYSDFGELTGCPIKWNNCTTERRTIWWNVSSIQTQCPYERIGTFTAFKKGSHFLIRELQASLVTASLKRNDTTACRFHEPKFVENDIVLSIIPKRSSWRSKRSQKDKFTGIAVPLMTPEDEAKLLKGHKDPENAKFQFVVDQLHEQIESQVNAALREDCATRNMIIDVIKFITHNNATTAAKLLLQRNDVRAEVGHDGLWISPCERNKTEVNNYPIVFKSGVLSHYNQRKIDMALKMISEEKWIAVKTKRKKDELNEENEEGIIETETKHFIDRITEDFNIVSRGIQKIIDEISEPWVLISISIVAILVLTLLPMVFFQCNVCRIIFKLFKICQTKSRKRLRNTKRRQSQSELKELSSIDGAIELKVFPKKPKSTTFYKKLEFKPMEL